MSGEEAAVHVLPLCSLASLNWLPLVGLRKQGHVFRLFEVSDERKIVGPATIARIRWQTQHMHFST